MFIFVFLGYFDFDFVENKWCMEVGEFYYVFYFDIFSVCRKCIVVCNDFNVVGFCVDFIWW